MSSVLDRMLERASGRLSGVEPLIAPRFQQVALVETPVESTEKRATAPFADPIELQKQATDASPRAAEPRAAALVNPPQLYDLDRLLSDLQQRSSQKGREREASIVAAVDVGKAGNPQPSAADVPPGIVESVETLVPMPSAVAAREIKSEGTGSESAIPDAAKRQFIERPSAPVPSREPNSNRSGESPEAMPPEIHITIGSIELKAAPAREHPRPPAFRPKVSLDDYLKGRQGERT